LDPQRPGLWRLDRLERIVRPTEAQRAKLDEFKAASNKAAETMRAACPTDVPTTMVGRMEGCQLRWQAVPTIEGPTEFQCVAYCPWQ
jgi:hypothetical protein